jgi:hypothetical protein
VSSEMGRYRRGRERGEGFVVIKRRPWRSEYE